MEDKFFCYPNTFYFFLGGGGMSSDSVKRSVVLHPSSSYVGQVTEVRKI